MKPRHRYALAFSLALLPILIVAGVEVLEQDSEEICEHCGSTHKILEQHWSVLGATGHRTLHEEIEPRMLLRDFPEYHCDHEWHNASTKQTRTWDGSLIAYNPPIPPVVKTVSFCCGSDSDWLLSLYEENESFRLLVNDAVEDELVTREQVTGWFKSMASTDSNRDEMADEDAQAYEKLDQILKQVQRRAPNPGPLPFRFIHEVQFYE